MVDDADVSLEKLFEDDEHDLSKEFKAQLKGVGLGSLTVLEGGRLYFVLRKAVPHLVGTGENGGLKKVLRVTQ
jgi:hypothetical protein